MVVQCKLRIAKEFQNCAAALDQVSCNVGLCYTCLNLWNRTAPADSNLFTFGHDDVVPFAG